MGKWSKQIDWLREQIGWDEQSVQDRKSGLNEDFQFRDGERINVTDKAIEDAQARIVRNQKLARAYEKLDE